MVLKWIESNLLALVTYLWNRSLARRRQCWVCELMWPTFGCYKQHGWTVFKMSIRKRQSSIHEYIIIYKPLSNINQSLDWHRLVLKHAFGDLCSGTTYSTVRLLADSEPQIFGAVMRMRESEKAIEVITYSDAYVLSLPLWSDGC